MFVTKIRLLLVLREIITTIIIFLDISIVLFLFKYTTFRRLGSVSHYVMVLAAVPVIANHLLV